VPGRPGPWRAPATSPAGPPAGAGACAGAAPPARRGATIPLGLLACAVGYSRVHTGVHYPGDVVAGAVLGTGAAAVVLGAVGGAAGWETYLPFRAPRR
ncbi:phosphatase PAP2 family protein, partial [Streptomyces sp. NPDC058964]|uniref:phosphatase PAP2 family protein n=1 Tax=Streptomyces sp. NPDC058964 TaxID=3346681 RepID=UPI0036B57E1D